jgi:hypothetical protein
MCEDFVLAASAPLFSFLYTLYATLTGDGVASRAADVAQKIKSIGNLNDNQSRAVLRLVYGYGAGVVLVTGLIATVLSYVTALFSSQGAFGSSPIYQMSIVIGPIILLVFCIMVMNSVGPLNLFTHKVLSPLRNFGTKATFPFTYGSLINAAATFSNAVLLLIFAITYGVFDCNELPTRGDQQISSDVNQPVNNTYVSNNSPAAAKPSD